jgi:Meiotically up-regulated gene 113
MIDYPYGPVIYFVGTDPSISRLVKIGRSVNLRVRLTHLRANCPVPLRLIAAVPNKNGTLEDKFHEAFADLRAHNEWFDLGDNPLATITARIGDLDSYGHLLTIDQIKTVAEARSRTWDPGDLGHVGARLAGR